MYTKKAFRSLVNLKRLDLSNNEIDDECKMIDAPVCKCIKKLEKLSLGIIDFEYMHELQKEIDHIFVMVN